MMKQKLVAMIAILALFAAVLPGPAFAAAPVFQEDDPQFGANTDNPSDPLGDARAALKRKGTEAKLSGKAGGSVLEVARGQYVELEREGEDTIWTVLAEFGTEINPTYGGTPGPLHNQIPRPDRELDNTTIWAPNFNQAYYKRLLFSEERGFSSMRNYYIEQSSNRYAVNGDVTDWVRVPFNEARYGANYCGGIVCSTTWLLIRDSVNAWYQKHIDAGVPSAEIDAYLSKFDVWDRNDYDDDGNFDEPDGYIDHFQSVHAGVGEETGGGAQGTDAIWSHRWYAFFNLIGSEGPAFNLAGGVQVGGSSYWVGDYTIEPENGGVGVFAHEFGHDLGLPDLYDTSGNTSDAENSTGFWTLMSSGSYLNDGKRDLGSKPGHMSAYEKIFLGWSNTEVVLPGQAASIKLGPAETNTKQAQQLVVLLPDKVVDSFVGTPFAGEFFYHSGAGNDLDNSMTREMTLPDGAVTLSAQVRYDIELDWDYAYLTVNGTSVPTNLSTDTNPNGQNFGFGITGSTAGEWVELTADLSAFAGQVVTLGFRYWTDVATVGTGLSVDEIAITGQSTDGGETDPGWVYVGFARTNGTVTKSYFNAYFAEYRQYRGFDSTLRTGPYNFVTATEAERFPYQDGLLVWYYDTSFENNNVGDNCAAGRCGGLVLPVDAHPELLIRPDSGLVWRPRIQSYDATFGLERTDRIALHASGIRQRIGGLEANPLFDDTLSYWVAPNPEIGHFGWSSVPLPATGTTIQVMSVSAKEGFMQVQVNK